MKEGISFDVDLIRLFTGLDDIEELYKETIKHYQDTTVIKREIDNGVFTNSDKHFAIWDIYYIEKIFRRLEEKSFEELSKVKKYYRGENYLIVMTDEGTYSFNISYFSVYVDFFTEMYYQLDSSDKEEMFIGNMNDGKVLLIKTDFFVFGVAEKKVDNHVEEERLILSQRIEESEPFFKYQPIIHFDWDKLLAPKEETFERLVEELLIYEQNLIKITPLGKTKAADRGRDLEVIESRKSFAGNQKMKWLVQCKFSKNSVSPTIISGWVERVIEHNYDGYWLITNNDITPSLFDQFKDIEKNKKYSIKTKIWQRTDLNIKLNLFAKDMDKNKYFKG